MNDKRSSQRVDAGHLVSIEIFDDKGELVQAGMALSRDLSRSGVQIETRMEYPNLTRVKIEIALTDDFISIEGLVKHAEKLAENLYNLGIKFENIPAEDLALLQKKYPQI